MYFYNTGLLFVIESMFSSSIIRYIICCVLIIHSSAIEQNKGSANKIDSKDQHAKKGNVFNILNRFYNRGSKSIDRTFIPETIKEKENVQNRKSDQVRFFFSPTNHFLFFC